MITDVEKLTSESFTKKYGRQLLMNKLKRVLYKRMWLLKL